MKSWLNGCLTFYPRPVLAFGYCRCLRLSLLSTCQHRNASRAISTSLPQPWSCCQASMFNWRNTPSKLCDFHSQSQGRCWYFRTALETLSTQIRGRVISLPRERKYWTFWSQDLTVDPLRRIYLTSRDLTSWSQLYRDNKSWFPRGPYFRE